MLWVFVVIVGKLIFVKEIKTQRSCTNYQQWEPTTAKK